MTVSRADRGRAERIRARQATAARIRAHRQQRLLGEEQGHPAGLPPERPSVLRADRPDALRAGRPDAARADRPVVVRANRLANAGWGAFGFVVLVIGAFGVYRVATKSNLSGPVVILFAAVVLAGVGRRLGRGRLLVLKLAPSTITLTNSWQPEATIDRTAGLHIVLWVHSRYRGAAPRPRGMFLVDDEGAQSYSRMHTFSTERLHRLLTTGGIPVEVVEAPAASLALAHRSGSRSGREPPETHRLSG